MNNDPKSLMFQSILFFEIGLLCSMFLTLIIPSELASISPWNDISPLLLLRASLWLLGLCILPGLYVLRLTRIAESLSEIGKIAIGMNLSLILVGLVTLILYYAQKSITLLPWFVLSALVILGCVHCFKIKIDQSTVRPKFSKLNPFLMAGIVAAISIAFSVQIAQRYLMPGDIWVSLKPAVEIVSQRNVYESLGMSQYPLMFGFILAGLSVCSGLPVVNTYVFLFPLVTLNIISFFVLVKVVFNRNDKVGVIASILYAFGGGLAWLIQTVIHHGTTSMWSLNFSTHDIYFVMPFWNTMEFSHRALALTLSYASIIAFVVSNRLENRSREMIALTLSSLLMLFSFFIHMLEPLILVPIILALAYAYRGGRRRYISLGFLAIITILIAYSIDFLMSGYYSWLASVKVETFLLPIFVNSPLIYSLIIFGGISIIILIRRFLSEQLGKLHAQKSNLQRIKQFMAIGLIGIYLLGLLFWAPSALYEMAPFPWYLYVTRYGFVGILALVGVAVARWREKWFMIASFWSILVLFIGSIWWGRKINAYLFPMVALLAAVGINNMWAKANSSIHIAIVTANSVRRCFKLNLKPIMAALIITTLGLSFTSLIYGTVRYSSMGFCMTDDEARALSWINQNIPENATVLMPNIYRIYKGVETIGCRKTYLDNGLPTVTNAASFVNFTEKLRSYNIMYAVSIEDEDKALSSGFPVSYSPVVFQSGNVKVLRLPVLSTPSLEEYTVAVVDRELLGFFGDAGDFGWIDDSLSDGWSYRNVEAESDGEVLTFKWEFHTEDNLEPSMKKYLSPINTNAFPYIVVRYRNTAETSTSAENNVGQIISLVNETGYPEGFVKNLYLPISKEEAFCVFVGELPENQNIAEVGIWMRNYEGLNGTIGLQIDYVGFASSESLVDQSDIRFLSMALPSLWPTKYSIFSDFHVVGNAPILVSTYDKSVLNYLENVTSSNIFVFLNLTAVFPSWGTGWRKVNPDIISGYLDGKKVVIVGVNSLYQEDMIEFSSIVYEEIKI